MATSWQTLGTTIAPTALTDARLQLHWAAQVPAAAADRWIAARADDSHTNLGWNRELGALVGHAGDAGLAVGLRPATMELLLVDAGGAVVEQLALEGRTLPSALAWADERLGARGGGARGLRLRDYEMPDHPVRAGRVFVAAREPQLELARWFANADRLLRALAAGERKALPVRCWPHHLDIASILLLDAEKPVAEARQIGFGLSPGDGQFAEPYFYLTPWPIADDAEFAPLDGGGGWHRGGFTGAVLTGSALVAGAGDAAAQETRALGFFKSAFGAAQSMIPGM